MGLGPAEDSRSHPGWRWAWALEEPFDGPGPVHGRMWGGRGGQPGDKWDAGPKSNGGQRGEKPVPSRHQEVLGTETGGCQPVLESRIRPCLASLPSIFDHLAPLICKAQPSTPPPLVLATLGVTSM